jgi:hypothetical protein
MLRVLAAGSRVILTLDDAQWVDSDSARILAFALGRVPDNSVTALCAVRTKVGEGFDPLSAVEKDRSIRIEVRAMTPEDLHLMLVEHLGSEHRWAQTRQIHALTGGNPWFSLQVARTARARGEAVPSIPPGLKDLTDLQLEQVRLGVRQLLEMVSTMFHPSVAALMRLGGDDAMNLLDEAVGAEIVEVSGDKIAFTHPLLASGLYAGIPPGRKRTLHQRLAAAADGIEERARHLAAAALSPDESVATSLEQAADLARRRGAPGAAARMPLRGNARAARVRAPYPGSCRGC